MTARRMWRVLLPLVGFVAIGGCGLSLLLFPPDSGSTVPPGKDFDTARLLILDTAGEAVITGTIEGDDPAVYDLGPFEPGDRIIVAVDAAVGSVLDPTAAVFDANREVFALNDDGDLEANILGSRIDEVVSVASEHYYLAIARFFFDARGGAYEGTVRIERGGTVTPPPVQVLVMNFAGGSVTLPGEGTITMNAFDAADIDAAYAGKTEEIKAGIVACVRENFEDTSLQIVTSDDPAPEPGTFSTMYFGSFSASKFGLAEAVDQGNRDRCDDGIVFTDKFDDPFATQPTVAGMAIAIGNVAAHEAGHLLGLNHVADITALMDSTGTASTLLADQEFKIAPLHAPVFPIGEQNAPLILGRVVPTV